MIFVFATVILFSIDYCAKRYVDKTFDDEKIKKLCNGKVWITKSYNEGAAMGIFKNHKGILKGITIAGNMIVAFFFVKSLGKGYSMSEKIALTFGLAGSMNNGVERLTKGRVVDYIQFPKLKSKIKNIVFNLSDFFIFIGAGIIFIVELIRTVKD